MEPPSCNLNKLQALPGIPADIHLHAVTMLRWDALHRFLGEGEQAGDCVWQEFLFPGLQLCSNLKGGSTPAS